MQLGPRRKREPTWFMEIEDRFDCRHCLRLSITSNKVRGPAVVSSTRAGSEASPRRGIAIASRTIAANGLRERDNDLQG